MNILNLLKNDQLNYLLLLATRETLIRKVKEINLLETLPYEILITEILPNIDVLDLFNLCQKSEYLSKLCQDQQALDIVKYDKSREIYIEQGSALIIWTIYNRSLKTEDYNSTISINYILDILRYAKEITSELRDTILKILYNITEIERYSLLQLLEAAITKDFNEIVEYILNLSKPFDVAILYDILYLAFAFERIESIKLLLFKINKIKLIFISDKLKSNFTKQLISLTTTEAIIDKLLENGIFNYELIFYILIKVINYRTRNIIDYILSKLSFPTYLKDTYFNDMLNTIEFHPDIDITPKVVLKYEQLMVDYIDEGYDEVYSYDNSVKASLDRLANIVRNFSIEHRDIFVALVSFLRRHEGIYPLLEQNYREEYIERNKLGIERGLVRFLIKYFPDDFLELAVYYFNDNLLNEFFNYDFQPSKEAYETAIEGVVKFEELKMLEDILDFLPAEYEIITEEFINNMIENDPYLEQEIIDLLNSYI